MGQAHSSGAFFHDAAVKEHFSCIQTLWSEEELSSLINRLKDMTLNFSLDKVKFSRLLQLSTSYEMLIAKWFEEFANDRASLVVDGLEFLAASVLISSKVALFSKICLLFNLFDLDKTGVIRKDEFTIFLKAATTGLHRMVRGVPGPASVMELSGHSTEFFANLTGQVLSKQDLLAWMTEAHFSLHYLSVLSKLRTTVFVWGANRRLQLGLNMEPREQRLPVPLLPLEGVQIAKIASNESHCLFLSVEGRVWSTGSGFCGILGHGNVQDCPQPRLIDSLAHTTVVDVAVGVRHSVAVSEKGQVFSWGSADLHQLGHGSTDDKEVYEYGFDAKNGGSFAFVSKPMVVMGLHGARILGKRAACCNFSTLVLSDKGRLYSWGNNTDGQCGHGQRCPDHALVYVDPHMQRTAMQTIMVPKLVETTAEFQDICCGAYHVMATDTESRLWTWGQGMWGKLGHEDQRSMYGPTVVEHMRYNLVKDIAAGESHSVCLAALYRLTITGAPEDAQLSPFSLLALPIGRCDRHSAARQPVKLSVQPPGTQLKLNAFVSAPLREIGLPYRHEVDAPIVNPDQHPSAKLQESILLVDRALWEGEWLKLATSDFDFQVKMSLAGAPIASKAGVSGALLLLAPGSWDAATDLAGHVCVFDVSYETASEIATREEVMKVLLDHARQCIAGQAQACICILPKGVEVFTPDADSDRSADLRNVPFGFMPHQHGEQLKSHCARLINARIAESPDGLLDEVRPWKERREEFTGKVFYEHEATGQKRWAAPIVFPGAACLLLSITQDHFLQRLKALVDLQPKGIIVCQQSFRPDVEMVRLPEPLFDLENLSVPIAQVTYEAGEELKGVCASSNAVWVTMETQEYGGVFAWGNGTHGQVGLAGIENQDFFTTTMNSLTNEENKFASCPRYVAHLHEQQVVSISCGSAHSTAVTLEGEVFSWGRADGLGVPVEKGYADVPLFVEQLEGLVRAKKAFGGHNHSFVVADMPYKSIV